MQEAILQGIRVDGSTIINKGCEIDNKTSFRGVGLNNIRIDSEIKQLLEYNVRRMNWKEWYGKHRFLQGPVRLFWLISNYGIKYVKTSLFENSLHVPK